LKDAFAVVSNLGYGMSKQPRNANHSLIAAGMMQIQNPYSVI
jgi:hypothetical protein